MDFGRKGDAKRAMKLHWKEGISLKAAWKRVKSGKKSPKKRKAVSPKRKRVQNNAKKAMRMHHREGISLKEAWKRVNKFGRMHNYDLPLGFGMIDDCPLGHERNPKFTVSGRGKQACLKVCPPGQVRNEITNRCNKPDVPKEPKVLPPGYEINPETGRQRKICGPDEYRDPVTKKCRKNRPQSDMFPDMYQTKSLMSLPPGYEINPETGRQRKICGPDEYRDPVTKKCRKINPAVRGANLRRMPDNPQLTMPLLGFGRPLGRFFSPQNLLPGMYQHKGNSGIRRGKQSTLPKIKFGKACKHNSFGSCQACAAL